MESLRSGPSEAHVGSGVLQAFPGMGEGSIQRVSCLTGLFCKDG